MSLLSYLNPLSANLTKRSNTLKQFVGKLPVNCLSVFDYFVGLAFKGLIYPTSDCYSFFSGMVKGLSLNFACNLKRI